MSDFWDDRSGSRRQRSLRVVNGAQFEVSCGNCVEVSCDKKEDLVVVDCECETRTVVVFGTDLRLLYRYLVQVHASTEIQNNI